MRLAAKSVLVTGAASGIGRAVALRLAAEGARVVAADLDGPGSEATAALVRARGGEAVATRTDIADAGAVDALIALAQRHHGGLDAACNIAGFAGRAVPLLEQDVADFDRIMAVNARGTFLCLRAEIAHMLPRGGGRIVNMASAAGLVGMANLAPYVASKHAVVGLTRNAALEYGRKGIRVNAVCPGGIDTPMLESFATQVSGGAGDARAVMAPLHPVGRLGTVEEVAELVTWLCCPGADFLNGAAIPIDGAFTAR